MTLSLQKYVILDEARDVVGHSDSLIGCCRFLAKAAVNDLTWNDVREMLVDEGSDVKSVELFIHGYGREVRFEIAPKSDVEAKPHRELLHNHMTRDIKPPGQCPGCDRYHNTRNEMDC